MQDVSGMDFLRAFLKCFSFKRQKCRQVTEGLYILRNGYITDENQCSSTETEGAFQASKIRQKQDLAYYF